MEWLEFVPLFEAYVTQKNYNDANKIDALRNALKGNNSFAFVKFNNLYRSKKVSVGVDFYLSEIEKDIKPVSEGDFWRKKVMSLRFKDSGCVSLSAFFSLFQNFISRVEDAEKSSMSESRKFDYLLESLPGFKMKLMEQGCCTVDEIMTRSHHLISAGLDPDFVKREPKKVFQTDIEPKVDQKGCYNCHGKNHFARSCTKVCRSKRCRELEEHIAKDCPFRKNPQNPQASDLEVNAVDAVSVYSSNGERERGHVLSFRHCVSVLDENHIKRDVKARFY